METIFPLTASLLPKDFNCSPTATLPEKLKQTTGISPDIPFLADLAKIELAVYSLSRSTLHIPKTIKQRMVHPGVDLLQVSWQGLAELLNGNTTPPIPGDGFILLESDTFTNKIKVSTPSNHDLLALKIVAEDIDSQTAATEAQVSIGFIDNILYNAVQKGLLLTPPTKIVRPPDFCRQNILTDDLCSSPSFTLQWHITQNCDLHCRHCYDRSDRTTMNIEQSIHVLDDFYKFCKDKNVYGQISFTGGNPLLYPHFDKLYQETADRGFLTAILGNPMPKAFLDRMLNIQKPEFYQVSLEGLLEHNDYIRGPGHFDRVLDFLKVLKEVNIYSMVMLTLTRANVDQILPLAEILRDKTSLFTFNRLAMVGEGAGLTSVAPDIFPDFLQQFMDATADNPTLSLKDNLFNIHNHQKGAALQGGCAGVGCGAAFNFVSILPDGEVHACRKLPSLLGNIYSDSLTDIYGSSLASRYRMGSSACSNCSVRPGCGGCPAVSYGFGLDVFTDLDPYCFLKKD